MACQDPEGLGAVVLEGAGEGARGKDDGAPGDGRGEHVQGDEGRLAGCERVHDQADVQDEVVLGRGLTEPLDQAPQLRRLGLVRRAVEQDSNAQATAAEEGEVPIDPAVMPERPWPKGEGECPVPKVRNSGQGCFPVMPGGRGAGGRAGGVHATASASRSQFAGEDGYRVAEQGDPVVA